MFRPARTPAKDTAQALSSPCINVCVIDADSGLCRGCLRTLPEISAWSAASDDERREVLTAVASRRAQMTS